MQLVVSHYILTSLSVLVHLGLPKHSMQEPALCPGTYWSVLGRTNTLEAFTRVLRLRVVTNTAFGTSLKA